MEGSTKTRSPGKQQMAAEGAVTRNRSKKDVGAAVVPTRQRRGQSNDDRGVRDGGGAGKDVGAKGVVVAKDKRTRAKDYEGSPGGNAQSKDKGAKGGGLPQRINAPKHLLPPKEGCCGAISVWRH